MFFSVTGLHKLREMTVVATVNASHFGQTATALEADLNLDLVLKGKV